MAPTVRRAAVVFVFFWFLIGGLGHFLAQPFFIGIVPPWFPWPVLAVVASGLVELALAGAWLLPRWRLLAGWGLIAVILAVTPANVEMWAHPERYPLFPRWAYALRLVAQAGLLWLVWWASRPQASSHPATATQNRVTS